MSWFPLLVFVTGLALAGRCLLALSPEDRDRARRPSAERLALLGSQVIGAIGSLYLLLLLREGPESRAVLLLGAPLVAAALPLVLHRTRWYLASVAFAAALFLLAGEIGGVWLALYFWASALLLVCAGVLGRRRAREGGYLGRPAIRLSRAYTLTSRAALVAPLLGLVALGAARGSGEPVGADRDEPPTMRGERASASENPLQPMADSIRVVGRGLKCSRTHLMSGYNASEGERPIISTHGCTNDDPAERFGYFYHDSASGRVLVAGWLITPEGTRQLEMADSVAAALTAALTARHGSGEDCPDWQGWEPSVRGTVWDAVSHSVRVVRDGSAAVYVERSIGEPSCDYFLFARVPVLRH